MDIISGIKGLWVEEYRPHSIKDMVYCNEHEQLFNKIVETKELPNLMLYGTRAGAGKTSTAFALLNDLGIEYKYINGSVNTSKTLLDKGGIIDSFLSCESEHSSPFPYKVVFIDEVDGTSEEFKRGFKGFIEEYSSVARFICTTNFIGSMNEYESSRMIPICFDFNTEQMNEILPKFLNRMKKIVVDKKIPINDDMKKAMVYIAKENAPDMRKTIQHMYECYLKFGTLDMRCKEITIEDEDNVIMDILFDIERSIKDRYDDIQKLFKTNGSIVNRVIHIVDEIILPELMEIEDEKLWISVLKDISDCGKYYKSHPQKDILIKSLLVQIMLKIKKQGE